MIKDWWSWVGCGATVTLLDSPENREDSEELRDGIMQKSRGRMSLPRQGVNESPWDRNPFTVLEAFQRG